MDYEVLGIFIYEGLKGKDVPFSSDNHTAVPWKRGQPYQVFLSLLTGNHQSSLSLELLEAVLLFSNAE